MDDHRSDFFKRLTLIKEGIINFWAPTFNISLSIIEMSFSIALYPKGNMVWKPEESELVKPRFFKSWRVKKNVYNHSKLRVVKTYNITFVNIFI